MQKSRIGALAALAALTLGAGLVAGCGGSDDGGDTGTAGGGSGGNGTRATGSGATFPASAYEQWARTSGLASYQAKGSGAGIQDMLNGLIDFAGSDAPLNEEETASLADKRGGATPVYFPTLLGAVTVPANVDGVSVPLKLESSVIGDIFAGKVTTWNDPAIAGTNEGVTLPDKPIIVCVRADSSGTSFSFSRYLARESATFKAEVGESKTPNWKAKQVVKQPGNPGVAQCVKSNSNSIGYVDLGDAQRAGLEDKLSEVGVNGTFTAPSVETITEAGASAKKDPALIIDPGAETPAAGYPITITTWIVAYSDYAAAGRANGLEPTKAWLEYVLGPEAQGALAALGFAPLPGDVDTEGKDRIATLK
ncbi:MAG: phosphate ABC transporter substrate-binding protein PstS [Thermoleophilia bacterium]|nr:phosphate ABC transporter substrate-binding protein PstS [Thermoleophilia bacterium]